MSLTLITPVRQELGFKKLGDRCTDRPGQPGSAVDGKRRLSGDIRRYRSIAQAGRCASSGALQSPGIVKQLLFAMPSNGGRPWWSGRHPRWNRPLRGNPVETDNVRPKAPSGHPLNASGRAPCACTIQISLKSSRIWLQAVDALPPEVCAVEIREPRQRGNVETRQACPLN